MSKPARTDWLVTVTSPVANTYASVSLSTNEAEALVRVIQAIDAAACNAHRPSIDLKPLWKAGTREREQLRFNNIESVLADRARTRRKSLLEEFDKELRSA